VLFRDGRLASSIRSTSCPTSIRAAAEIVIRRRIGLRETSKTDLSQMYNSFGHIAVKASSSAGRTRNGDERAHARREPRQRPRFNWPQPHDSRSRRARPAFTGLARRCVRGGDVLHTIADAPQRSAAVRRRSSSSAQSGTPGAPRNALAFFPGFSRWLVTPSCRRS